MTSRSYLLSAMAVLTAATLTACQSDSPGLTTKPKVEEQIIRGTVVQKGDRVVAEYDPRVDILFVIDNSKSMENHQKNLAANIPRFVEEFAKIKSIDFHIAVTTVWDSSRYGVKDPSRNVPAVCPDGTVNWEPMGTLVPLIGPSDKLPKDGRRFVTRDDDFVTILSQSLSPVSNPRLFKDFVKADPSKPSVCASGPEKEEVFSPMVAALTNSSLKENAGFRRDGAFLVVIIVSDAKSEDVPDRWTPESVRDKLSEITGEAATGKKRFRVFSVAYKSGTRIADSCLPDPAFDAEGEVRPDGSVSTIRRRGAVIQPGENPLETLALLTAEEGGVDQVHGICESNYGDALGKYSALIKADTLNDMTLALPKGDVPQWFPPDDRRALRVFLGDLELSEGTQWRYQRGRKNRIIIYGAEVPWDSQPEAKIQVSYVPVEMGKKTSKVMGAE